MLSTSSLRARIPTSTLRARLRRPTFKTSTRTASAQATTQKTARSSSRSAPYLAELKSKYPHAEPRSLVVAFVVLHELTALVPLAVLFGAFHYLGAGAALVAWIVDETSTTSGKETGWKDTVRDWLREAETKAERVGRRYGLFGWSKESKEERRARRSRELNRDEEEQAAGPVALSKERLLVSGDVANAAAAYLAVKVGLDIVFSPAFARLNPCQTKRNALTPGILTARRLSCPSASSSLCACRPSSPIGSSVGSRLGARNVRRGRYGLPMNRVRSRSHGGDECKGNPFL
jgi:hypothetical protein